MPDFDINSPRQGPIRRVPLAHESLDCDEDMLIEHILENINNTPIGQVLKQIASLPEVRREKILEVRHQLTEGEYNLNERLDVALDKVLEDLTA